MAATGELAGVKGRNLKSIFWKMFAIYEISFTYLGGFWERLRAVSGVYVITPLVPFKALAHKNQN